MTKLLKVDKLLKKYLDKLYIEMMNEITAYVRDEIAFKKLTKGSQQILRTSGIYYRKILPPDWQTRKKGKIK